MIFFGIGLAIGLVVFALTRRVFVSVALFLLNWFIVYLALPVISFNFFGLPMLLLLNGVGILAGEFIAEETDKGAKKSAVTAGVIVAGIGFLWFAVIPLFTSWSLFHHREYRDLIGEVKDGVFSTDTTPVDIAQVRVVDQSLAARLAEKRLGEDAALGSQVNVGTMRIQLVGGRLYWVGSLDHSGFFKWWSNSRGTPGYMMVSATNERDVRLVQEISGKKVYLKYNDNCYFGNNLERYLYNHGYMTKGLTDYTFEIDDDGNPYWVVTRYEKKVGFLGKDAAGVVVLNAQTGEIREYGIDEAPPWIDRIQPEDLVTAQLNDWGELVHGWWNWSNKDKLKVTPGMSLVYGDDGKSYWYTGITSVGADKGTVGFVLVNTRTKEARMYRQAGATETAAMGSAEGAVQEKRYKATFPILYNISGVPTYFTTLKDDAGLVKLMAWVSVEDYNIVGIGETTKEAMRNYRRTLLTKGNDLAPDSVVTRQAVEGEVLRIGKDGANYYFLIKDSENKLFVGSVGLSVEIVVTNIGDLVRIEYDEGGNEIVDMAGFDNTAVNLQKTKAQETAEERAGEVRERKTEKRAGQNADAAWEDLTPDQKRELLKKK